MPQTRVYQKECHQSIRIQYAAGCNRMVVVMATGTGKTVVFATLKDFLQQHFGWLNGQWLVLAHRTELIDQAAKKIKHWNPDATVGIEMGSSYTDPNADFIVASVQTLGLDGSRRILQMNPANFSGVIIDEAHHAAAETYQRIIKHFGLDQPGGKRLLLGFTATPKRGDGKGLDHVFDKIAYELSMWDAVKQGWLSDVRGKRVVTNTSLDDVKTTAGDFNQKQLETTVNTEDRNSLIVNTWKRYGDGRKTVGFTADIQHAKDLAQCFVDHGVSAKAVWGVDPERKEKLADHAAGKFQVLLNAQMLTEGYDDWSIRCVLMAKPTKSPASYTQMIGRGTRLQEGIDNLLDAKKAGTTLTKDDCLVLDFVDVTKKHSLVTTASLAGLNTELDLDGNSALEVKERFERLQQMYPEADLSRVKDLNQIAGDVIDVDLWKVEFSEEVMKESTLQWHKQDESTYFLFISKNEGARIQQDVLDHWNVKIIVGKNNFDEQFSTRREAFKFSERMVKLCNGDQSRFLLRKAAWDSKPANPMQIAYLQRMGLPYKEGIKWGEANKLIQRYKSVRSAQMLTQGANA